MADQNDASAEPLGDVHASSLGLLLSQISTRRAFPDARSEADVNASGLQVAENLAEGPFELMISPGMLRIKGPKTEGRIGGGDRKPISGFSKASRRRMLATLGTLDLASIPGVPIFVTLTYPRLWRDACPTGRDAKRHLDLFRRRWVRRWGSFQGVWKLEFQPRHRRPAIEQLAPHFHILTVCPGLDPACEQPTPTSLASFREWVSLTWWEVVGSEDNDHLRAGTQVVEADGSTAGRIIGYFAGYTAGRSKEEQHIAPDDWPGLGRFWGVSGISRVVLSVEFSEDDFFKIRRVLENLMAKRAGRKRRSRSLYTTRNGIWVALEDAPDLARRLAMWLATDKPAPTINGRFQE